MGEMEPSDKETIFFGVRIVSVANAAQSSMEAEALGVFNALRTLPSKTYILVCSEDAQLCKRKKKRNIISAKVCYSHELPPDINFPKVIALTTYLENEQRSSVLRLWKIIQWRKGTTTSAWTKRTLQAWAHKTTARAAKAAQEKRMESLRASLEPGVQFPELIILPANSGSGRLFYGPQSMIWDTTALRGTSEVAPAAVSAGGHHSDTDSTAGDGLGWATERSSHYDESGYDAGTSDDDDRDDGNGRAQTTPTPPDQHTQSEAPPPPANQDVAIVNHAQQPTAQEPTTEPQPAQSAPPSPAPHPHQVADIDAAASADASWDEWSFLFEDVGGI
ncbi:hypothetical protein HK104_008466 [Borealophlyctis nickersoniae]|nr:hypothetical protein HK104_008466 [Borealophlyctis nickersoniae]